MNKEPINFVPSAWHADDFPEINDLSKKEWKKRRRNDAFWMVFYVICAFLGFVWGWNLYDLIF